MCFLLVGCYLLVFCLTELAGNSVIQYVLTSATVIADQLKSPYSELAAGKTVCMDQKAKDLLLNVHKLPFCSLVQCFKVSHPLYALDLVFSLWCVI